MRRGSELYRAGTTLARCALCRCGVQVRLVQVPPMADVISSVSWLAAASCLQLAPPPKSVDQLLSTYQVHVQMAQLCTGLV